MHATRSHGDVVDPRRYLNRESVRRLQVVVSVSGHWLSLVIEMCRWRHDVTER